MNTMARIMTVVVATMLFLPVAFPLMAKIHGEQRNAASRDTLLPATNTDNVQKKAANEKPIEHFAVNNADVRSVFKQLSEFAGYDIVMADNVTGTVSVSVSNKTWREIVGIVCKIQKLTAVKEQSYYYIVPSEEYRKDQMSDATMNRAEESLEELKREVIKLDNAKAQEMSASIQSMLSTRGKITVVERNNALIIFDTDQNIEQIKKTIKILDVETDQVSISCKIIEVSSGALQSLGVRWGYFDRVGGTDVSAEHIPVGAATTSASGAVASVSSTSIIEGALEKLTFGVVSQDKFSAALEYLFQNNKAEVVAQPQITTVDNKEAKIFMGSQVPVKYLDKSFNTVIQMVDAGTELTVTPHITGEKRIMLALEPKKKSYTLTNDLPIIDEQSASTNVVVSDGETVVIAGLTSNQVMSTEEGIPVLKDIPLIGNLFKRTTKTIDKRDLIVFVTPHIINKKVEAAPSVLK